MTEFLHMGGYAFYVWTSMALGLIVLVLNIVLPLASHRSALHKAEDYHNGNAISEEEL